MVNERQLHKQTRELLDELEIKLDSHAKMKDLSTAYIQMVEIAKAISYDSDLVIMDEPTSAITDKEVAQLFKMINRLRDKGVAIIYITHKMDEVFEITDECTVLRDGQYVGSELSENLTNDKLITMMVGREVSQIFPREFHDSFGEVALEVKGLCHDKYFKDISFKLRKGEILGFAGLMGAGRSEVMETIFGMNLKSAGEIYVHGKPVTINSPKDAIKNRIGLLTEDRKRSGCFLPLSVADNIIMPDLGNYNSPLRLVDEKKVSKNCEDQRLKLRIKTPSIDQLINT